MIDVLTCKVHDTCKEHTIYFDKNKEMLAQKGKQFRAIQTFCKRTISRNKRTLAAVQLYPKTLIPNRKLDEQTFDSITEQLPVDPLHTALKILGVQHFEGCMDSIFSNTLFCP